MRKYLSTIHERSDSHKKRFALLTSACFTLLMFSIWTMVNFPPELSAPHPVEESESKATTVNSIGPLDSLRAAAASSLDTLDESFDTMRQDAFDKYYGN